MKHLIRLAAKVGAKRSGRRPHFNLVAIGIRADGAMVVSRNATTRDPEPKAHAEARLVRKLDRGSTVYVLRFSRKGDLTMAEPCADCAAKLRAKDCVVWYSDWNGEIVKNKS